MTLSMNWSQSVRSQGLSLIHSTNSRTLADDSDPEYVGLPLLLRKKRDWDDHLRPFVFPPRAVELRFKWRK
jgi:hypothetical protein